MCCACGKKTCACHQKKKKHKQSTMDLTTEDKHSIPQSQPKQKVDQTALFQRNPLKQSNNTAAFALKRAH
jgi:hypothetical protein